MNTFDTTAWLYDLDQRDLLSADIPFYLRYARAAGGGTPEVLELGCGTGRVALPLAAAGARVTGLDLSAAMLTACRRKLADTPPEVAARVTLVQGNMADFRLAARFGLIIAPFRAFQALTEEGDIAGALACIRAHLAPGGRFIVNVFRPHSVLDEGWCYPETTQWERADAAAGLHVRKTHWGDRIDTARQIIYPHFAYYVTAADGETRRYTEDLALKYYYEPQLEAVLRDGGFAVRERLGWYDGASVEDARRELIFVCEREG